MRKKKETVSTPQERKKKDKSTLRVRHQSFLTEMRDRQKERKKRLAGTVAVKKGTGSGQKGRKREEWKRLDALGAVFLSPPLHLFSQPSLLAVDDWGAAAVGRSVVRREGVVWQSLQQRWWWWS